MIVGNTPLCDFIDTNAMHGSDSVAPSVLRCREGTGDWMMDAGCNGNHTDAVEEYAASSAREGWLDSRRRVQ